MKRECEACGTKVITNLTPTELPEFYCLVELASYSDICNKLKIARGALADIAYSKGMTLALAKKKAARIYKETEQCAN